MVGAGEVPRVALVGANDPVAPVPAHIQEGPQFPLAVAAQDDRLLAHVGMEVIVHIGNQRFVAYHQPGPPEDLFLLFGVNVLVNEDTPVKLPGLQVDYPVIPAKSDHCGTPARGWVQALINSINHPVHSVQRCSRVGQIESNALRQSA